MLRCWTLRRGHCLKGTLELGTGAADAPVLNGWHGALSVSKLVSIVGLETPVDP